MTKECERTAKPPKGSCSGSQCVVSLPDIHWKGASSRIAIVSTAEPLVVGATNCKVKAASTMQRLTAKPASRSSNPLSGRSLTMEETSRVMRSPWDFILTVERKLGTCATSRVSEGIQRLPIFESNSAHGPGETFPAAVEAVSEASFLLVSLPSCCSVSLRALRVTPRPLFPLHRRHQRRQHREQLVHIERLGQHTVRL